MARSVSAILRDIDTIEKSKYLNNNQKATAIRDLQKEIAEQVGQGTLDLGDGGQANDKAGTPKKA